MRSLRSLRNLRSGREAREVNDDVEIHLTVGFFQVGPLDLCQRLGRMDRVILLD